MEFLISIVSFKAIMGVALAVAHVLGILFSVDSIFRTQSAQGAIAWAISLNTIPFVAVPLYVFFGRNKLYGYVNARYIKDLELTYINKRLLGHSKSTDVLHYTGDPHKDVLAYLAGMPFTRGNHVELLINGKNTFDSIFQAIDNARHYILVQFFIVENDSLGQKLKTRLLEKTREGVVVNFIFDEIGCYNLPSTYIEELRKGGVTITPFNTSRGRRNRFQLNFRNHRKTVIVDGRIAFVGGHNVGDRYLGLNARLGNWRDTHVKVEGPAVQFIQLCFVEDWFWAIGDIPNLIWDPVVFEKESHISLVIGSGPADNFETCGLFFMNAINSAQKRIWITSPYFVPDSSIVKSLQLAALRGVDVRIMLPEKPDHLLVYLSAFSYINETERSGVKFFRYQAGFMHQKVMLVDDNTATVGTANFDNRSFRLNFETTLMFLGRPFAKKVEQMLLRDFEHCVQINSADFRNKPFWYRLAVHLSRLMAPLQ